MGPPETMDLARAGCGRAGPGSEQASDGRYRKARATGADGTGEEESESAIVPVKRGNRACGTPWRKGPTGSSNLWRAT